MPVPPMQQKLPVAEYDAPEINGTLKEPSPTRCSALAPGTAGSSAWNDTDDEDPVNPNDTPPCVGPNTPAAEIVDGAIRSMVVSPVMGGTVIGTFSPFASTRVPEIDCPGAAAAGTCQTSDPAASDGGEKIPGAPNVTPLVAVPLKPPTDACPLDRIPRLITHGHSNVRDRHRQVDRNTVNCNHVLLEVDASPTHATEVAGRGVRRTRDQRHAEGAIPHQVLRTRTGHGGIQRLERHRRRRPRQPQRHTTMCWPQHPRRRDCRWRYQVNGRVAGDGWNRDRNVQPIRQYEGS